MASKPPTQDAANSEKNIYIPSFIAAKPFYVGDSESDYLEHQRLKAEPKDTLDKAKWYERGRKVGLAATKYRKGACENCGAMTHKTKECLSRPRKHGAKWTGKDIQADERVDEVKLGWDAKRDRWNGYDAREYDAVVKEYEELEELRQSATKTQTPGEQSPGEDGEAAGAADDDTARYAEETDMGRSQPTSTRQLRLREDTAKYLLNLDLDSARYDPKTRSMDAEASSLQPTQTGEFEGFARPADSSSDAAAFERAQRYAWETQEGNNNNNNNDASASAAVAANLASTKKLHLQANPTEGEFLLKQKTTEDAARKESQRKALLARYGDASASTSTSTSSPSHSLTSANPSSKPPQIRSSSTYVEYDKFGQPKVPAHQLAAKPKSKYAEDVLTNNHGSVWGSFWADFTWGYACCHSTVRNSYCTGEAGRRGFEEMEGMRTGETLAEDEREEEHKEADESRGDVAEQSRPSKKRGYNDTRDRDRDGVSEGEMEAYKRSKMAGDDPMRLFSGLQDGV